MARYTGPVCRLCRREGKKLYLKGERCTSGKCALERRSTAPGQHGAAKKKMGEYGVQLREKQATRRYYGVLEKQFKNYYDEAARKEGMTGENLLLLLERRLDNVVYRAGFGMSRRQARQLVLHRHFTVNGERVNIPSYLVKPGDVIAVHGSACDKIKENVELNSARPVPMWMSFDANDMKVTFNRLPERSEIDLDVEEQLIVELYSK